MLRVVAAAAVWGDVFVGVFFAVVVGELFSRADVAPRLDEDATLADLRLTVGPTGVVDIAGDVVSPLSVDRLP